jgi:hypothetical protein
MERLVQALAVLAIIVSVAVIATTSAALPPQVASHFVGNGAANGFQSREAYELIMILLAAAIPMSIMLLMAALPRVSPALVNVPNIRAWLSGPRREETIAAMATRGAVAAIIFTFMIAAVHLVVVDANRQVPPHLDPAALGTVIGVFMVLMALWVVGLLYRFRSNAL